MTEISEYMSNQDEIARLNKQVDMIAGFYKSIYDDKIKAFNLKITRLTNSNSAWKRKYENLNSDNPSITRNRTLKAKALVVKWIDGNTSLTLKEIAKQCFKTESAIKMIASQLRAA